MSEQNNIDPHHCNAGDPVTTVEVTPAADIQPGDADSLPETLTVAKISGRRIPFAAPAEDKKRTSGGLDSLGKGHLP